MKRKDIKMMAKAIIEVGVANAPLQQRPPRNPMWNALKDTLRKPLSFSRQQWRLR